MYTDEELSRIYDRTSGYCHLCWRKLAFTNYNKPGRRGAWEVEHSNARANGGSDRLANLYPAHITCNRSKQARSTRSARAEYGYRSAPLSAEARKKAKVRNALTGGALGALAGALVGPGWPFVGAAIGAGLGHKRNPDKDRR